MDGTLRFGADLVRIGAGAGALDAQSLDADADRVHLVVQVGNRFQAEHPDVRVLISRGRYLLVDLDPVEVQSRTRSACYTITRPPSDGIVFEERARPPAPSRARGDVQAVVDLVTQERLAAAVGRLVAFGTRESTSQGFRLAAEFAGDTLASLGWTVRQEAVTVGAARSINVVADRVGTDMAAGILAATAHLDSVNHVDQSGPAPGADDNASGVAGVLEIAHCLEDHALPQSVRLILFGGEEQGLFGSTQYVTGLPASHEIRGVVNMDMIATMNGTAGRSVLIEGGPVSRHLIDAMAEVAHTYTGLAVQTSLHFFNSDHVPFIRAGIPAVLLIEGNDSANTSVHTERDTIDRLDVALMAEILRMHLGWMAGHS
jgi:hypothetical protein